VKIAGRVKSAAARRRGGPLGWLGGLLAVYLAVPLVAFALRLGSAKDRGFGVGGLWGALRTSVESATISVALVALLGIPLAHSLAKRPGIVSSIVGVVVQLPLALPPVMGGIVLVYLVGPYSALGRFFGGRLTDSVAGIVLAQTFVSAPFLVIAARSAFAAVDPALDELATTLGHRRMTRFFRVELRAAAPGIRAGMLLTWLRAIGEYGATVVLAYHPYSLPVYTYVQFSSTGIPATQAPTALALGAAALGLMVSQLRRPASQRRRRLAPPPAPPGAGEAVKVAFDLDLTVGSFHLLVAHRARSHRLAVLGPSGSGKSLTLKSIAGLFGEEAGPVIYGDEVVSAQPTEARHVGYVPQGLALFPWLTVWEQLLFGEGADAGVASWWMEVLDLEGLENRVPAGLSGGQRQRVCLAQALSRRPRLVLLDEPFSALDAPVRKELRQRLRRLQQEAGLSTVLVTHDPEEAALLADEVVVISAGRVLQAGLTTEVYRRPSSPEVAQILGIDNVLTGKVEAPRAVRAGSLVLEADAAGVPGSEVLWCIRPEHVLVDRAGNYSAQVVDRADLGTYSSITLCLDGGLELRARADGGWDAPRDGHCSVELPPEHITVWPVPGSG
jgi:ABC-type sulfate/molybdate transport systems ATPase subunit/ABC-type sulfate transport system permease component